MRKVEDFSSPEPAAKKPKKKSKHSSPSNVWGEAMKALRKLERQANGVSLTKKDVLVALKTPKKDLRPPRIQKIIKRLVGQGILLADGSPNIDHPTVVDMIINRP